MPRPIRFKCLVLALLLALACACQKPGAPSPLPGSESEPPTHAAQALSDMLMAAELYEVYCGGVDFDGVGYEAVVSFAYGWLARQDLLGGFAKTDAEGESCYTLPQPTAEALCGLFFGVDIAARGEQYALDYYPAYDVPPPYALKGPDALPPPEGDGGYLLTFARVRPDGNTLREVLYRFVPVVLQEEPAGPIGDIHHKGDTVWRIAAVTNLSPSAPSPAQYEAVRIETVDALLGMAAAINSGDRQAQQKRYLLECDLDLEGVPFTPIGTNRPLLPDDIRDDRPLGFNAVFDGQGHAIRNLSVALTPPGSPESPLIGGFFSVIGPDGDVQGLTLENASVSTPVTVLPAAAELATGLLAGRCMGRVSDCHVSGRVAGGYQTGGFAGVIGNYENGDTARFARVTGCTASVSAAGDSELGGFAGTLHGAFVSDCRAEGEVIAVSGQLYGAPRAIGGFCGFSVEGYIEGCDASATVQTVLPGTWVGAFIGYNQGGVAASRYNLDKAPYLKAVGYTHPNAAGEITAYSSNVKPLGPV